MTTKNEPEQAQWNEQMLASCLWVAVGKLGGLEMTQEDIESIPQSIMFEQNADNGVITLTQVTEEIDLDGAN